jgi:hypothetical protein
MKITVKKSDIRRADTLLRKRSKLDIAERCPIACAVRRIKRRDDILVSRSVIHVGCVTPNKVYRLPEKAREFIWRYDQRIPVQPFSFHITRLKKRK